MQGRIKVLKDVDKSNILPMTYAKAVYVDEENTLDKALDDIKKGTVKVIDATGAELKNLVDAGALVPGSYYRYTDWRVEMWDTDTEAEVKILDPYQGPTEPLILLANSNKTFYPMVRSELYPEDIVYFRFGAKYTSSSTKWGIILRREDPLRQIALPSDWRHLKVKLYKPVNTLYYVYNKSSEGSPYDAVLPTVREGEGIHISEGSFYLLEYNSGAKRIMKGTTSTNSAVPANGNSLEYWTPVLQGYETFKSFSSGADRGIFLTHTYREGNYLRMVYIKIDKQNPQWYSMVDDKSKSLYQEGLEGLIYNYYENCTDIRIGDSYKNIFKSATRLVLGSNCNLNHFEGSNIILRYNCIGNIVYGSHTTLGSSCNYNNIQTACHNNELNYSCTYNFFGGDSDYNKLGHGCNNNQFDCYVDNNTFVAYASNNVFRPNRSKSKTIYMNVFDSHINDNRIYGTFNYNQIQSQFSSNVFQADTSAEYNKFNYFITASFDPTSSGGPTGMRYNKFNYCVNNKIEHDISWCDLTKFTGVTLKGNALQLVTCQGLESKVLNSISALSGNGTKRIYQQNFGDYAYYYEYRDTNNTLVTYKIP